MKTITVRRTMLILDCQDYALTVPTDFDAEDAISEDFGDFDERLLRDGVLLKEWTEGVDNDDLDLTVLETADQS